MGVKNLAISICTALFNVPVFILESVGDVTADVLSFSTSSTIGSVMNALKNIVIAMIPSVQGVGYAITTMFFIIGLIELCMNERMTVETFIKQFTYFALGVGLVYYSPEFFEKILEFGNVLTTYISNLASAAANSSEAYTNASSMEDILTAIISTNGGFMWIILIIIGLIIGVPTILLAAALLIVVYVISFTRIIEICARGTFLPIGFALISDDGWKGSGGRYFKKFLAVCSQGAAIALVGKFLTIAIGLAKGKAFSNFESLSTPTLSDMSSYISAFEELIKNVLMGEVVIIGLAIAGIIALFKTMQLISDAFGA